MYNVTNERMNSTSDIIKLKSNGWSYTVLTFIHYYKWNRKWRRILMHFKMEKKMLQLGLIVFPVF